MSKLFLTILNGSISASWLILAVLILRLVLKKAPKWVNVLLWGIVGLRLLLPVSIRSALSLIPSAETVPLTIEREAVPAIDSGIDAINRAVNPVLSGSFAPQAADSANPLQVVVFAASVLWIAGMAGMLLYAAVSYGRLRRNIRTATPYRDNIFRSAYAPTPFVLGILRPRIYLPLRIREEDLGHVIAHEQAHIRRKDHWWKLLGFLLLAVHWFNPLVWLSYALLCRDIELACDEKVIQKLGSEQRADYTQALLSCSVSRRGIAACPLAFGEVGVKERVRAVLHYKKPAFWVILLAVAVCVAAAACFLTDPAEGSDAGGDVAAGDPPAVEAQDGDAAPDAISARMASVTAGDIRHLSSGFDHVTAEALAPALNEAAGQRIAEVEGFRGYYEVTAYLSGGPETYGGDDESFHLYAGLEESVVHVLYSDGETGYFSDETLYWLIRNDYRTEDQIDEAAYDGYREIIEARAREQVDQSENLFGAAAFTGYEITGFTPVETVEVDGGQYEVYAWDVAFRTEDPDAVGWAGGMWLDAEGRVRAYEQDTYFVVQAATGAYRFLPWDLYQWSDPAERQEQVQRSITRAFAEA